jgi:hypothetical protein
MNYHRVIGWAVFYLEHAGDGQWVFCIRAETINRFGWKGHERTRAEPLCGQL